MSNDKKPFDNSLAADGFDGDEESCIRWEAALVDLLDGTLPAEEQAAFRAHADGCATCQELLREAGHGRDWVRMLHDTPPAVPVDLLGKILAKTGSNESIAVVDGVSGAAMQQALLPSGVSMVLPHPAFTFGHQREARLLMTAAMAFFSIALTLSLAGFKLSDLHTAKHAPASLEATASRQFFDTKKQVVSFYDNLRLVREMEATVEDLRHTSDSDAEKSKQPQRPGPSARRATSAAALPMLARETVSPTGIAVQAEGRITL